jgi:hypothetical protein
MKALIASLVSMLIVGIGLTSCSDGSRRDSHEASTGTIRAALSTVGPDGAKYVLPSGAFLLLSKDAWASSYYMPLDHIPPSGPATQSFDVPAASYQATLNGAVDGSAWQLVRIDGTGGMTTVAASLVDAMPYQFVIAPGGSYSLTFHFVLPTVGDVTFSSGTLDVGLQIDAGPTPGSGAHWVENAAVDTQIFNGFPSLQALMQAPDGTPVQVTIDMVRIGDWWMYPDTACATVHGTITTTTAHAGLAANLMELSGGIGALCVHSSTDPNAPNDIMVSLSRQGAPQTDALAAAIASDASPGPLMGYDLQVDGWTSVSIFSGGVLSLSKLAAGLSFDQFAITLSVSDIRSGAYVYTHASPGASGTGTFGATITVTP